MTRKQQSEILMTLV